MSIKIRDLKPDDMPKICELLRTREGLDEDGVQKRKILMEWCAFKNPFAGNETTYFIAEDQGGIIAHIGRMPMKFIINGDLQKGYYIHDLYVHPEYRKKGMGFFLSMAFYRIIEENSDSLCFCPWHKAINLEFHRKRGYPELSADKYKKILNPTYELKKILKIDFAARLLAVFVRGILVTADFFIKLYYHKYQQKVTKVSRFDFAFDNLSQRLSTTINISPLKSSEYLNWKYIDRPYSKMEALAISEEGEIVGFVVLGMGGTTECPEGTIIDISADPGNKVTVYFLCRAAIDYFKQRKVQSIKCCLTDPRFAKIFTRLLFFKISGAYPFTIINIKKAKDQKYIIDTKNWHLTFGDSDWTMFSVRPIV